MSANSSAIFLQANPNLLPTPRSPSKPFIYISKPSPRKRFVSPFMDGKPQQGYVSPTFMSGDCFYPQYETIKTQETSPVLTPKPSLYDTYVKRQTHQKTKTQPVIMITMPNEVAQQRTPTSNRSNEQSPQRSPIRSRTPSHAPTKSDQVSHASNQYHGSPKSTCSKTTSQAPSQASSSLISQLICPNCYNQDLIEQHTQREKIVKQKDKVLLERNLATELKNIQQEIDYEHQKRELEKAVLAQEYKEYQQRKKIQQEIQTQEKEVQRRIDTEQSEKLQMREKQDQEMQIHKRAQFLRGIEQQLAEREAMRAAERKRQSEPPNVLDIGEEYKVAPIMQLKPIDRLSGEVNEMLKQLRKDRAKEQHVKLNKSFDIALKQKAEAKLVQQQKDLEYAEYAKRQDELNKQIQQFEKLERDIKRQRLNAGLDEQLKLKKERLMKEKHESENRIFEATTQPPKQVAVDNCDGCSKQYIKEYLSRVKRPRSKLKKS